MNEIKKMYENVGVEKICTNSDDCLMSDDFPRNCDNRCVYIEYPSFTAEKQLEIVKKILFSTWWMNLKRLQFAEKFDEGLAQMINELWKDLTEEEKQQVKGILE